MSVEIPQVNILGMNLNAVNIPRTLKIIERWLEECQSRYICLANVYAVTESQHDENLRHIYNHADLVTPDGMPLVWLSRLRGFSQVRRVYGPDLLREFCKISRNKGYRHFFYGGMPGVAERLVQHLQKQFPGLAIAGIYSPPFRQLTASEEQHIVDLINKSHPHIVWVGLGAFKQEKWMYRHVEKLHHPVLIGVGAAFDFISREKKQAPLWMQRVGLEWLFRLFSEPKRLWRRYLINNPWFVILLLRQFLKRKKTSN